MPSDTTSADALVEIRRETARPGIQSSQIKTSHGALDMTVGASGAVPGIAWRHTRFQTARPSTIEVAAGAGYDMLVVQLPLQGRWNIEYPDSAETRALPRLSRLRRPSAMFRFAAGRYEQFGFQVSLDTVARWYGDHLPDGVHRLVTDRLRASLHHEMALTSTQRHGLQAALGSDHPLHKLQIEGLALQILGQVLMQVEEAPVLERGLSTPETRAAHEARQIVAGRLHQPPTLGELAAMTNVSARRLKLALHEEFGQTLHQLVTEARFEEACAALRAGESIKSLAFRLGYASVSAFGYAFRRRTGLSPGAWRESGAWR